MLGTAAALGIGAALGAAKYASDSESASRQRELQGKIATYSPWTGLKPSNVQDPNAFGDILQGAAGVGTLNQGLNAATAGPGAAGAAPLAATETAASPSLLAPQQLAATGSQNPWLQMGSSNYFGGQTPQFPDPSQYMANR